MCAVDATLTPIVSKVAQSRESQMDGSPFYVWQRLNKLSSSVIKQWLVHYLTQEDCVMWRVATIGVSVAINRTHQLQRVVFMCISYSVLCSCVSATACCVHVYQLQRVVFMCISYSVLCSCVSATACCVHVYQLQCVVFICISYSVLCSCVSATACRVHVYQLQCVVFMRISYSVLCLCVSATACCVHARLCCL